MLLERLPAIAEIPERARGFLEIRALCMTTAIANDAQVAFVRQNSVQRPIGDKLLAKKDWDQIFGHGNVLAGTAGQLGELTNAGSPNAPDEGGLRLNGGEC